MKQTLRDDLVAAVEKANAQQAQLFQHTPPQRDRHNPPSKPPGSHTRPNRHIVHVLLLVPGILPEKTNDPFLSRGVLVVATTPVVPAEETSQLSHLIGVAKAQTHSCRYLLADAVPAMTSTKKFVIINDSEDLRLVLLNLHALLRVPDMTTLPGMRHPHTTHHPSTTNPVGKTGITGGNGSPNQHQPMPHPGTTNKWTTPPHGRMTPTRTLIQPDATMKKVVQHVTTVDH